ncbi:hypothetical protein DYBT9275_01481 [Dyadobacter sp. CECT 9275]|uniref:Dialkylrecorsinol condensing enzyme n=1 Tax=Dyadobacter helix TaxID=2822344 RepID=A0A916N3G0_9BACT|nr:hypothetical protein [Dyadobacter sp. CECT 9275]CAG4994849.1 hypothetical protein DYBT9275_01481 [Dyadobacter sp. CECT 9275]
MKKILAVGYSQSGQLNAILDQFLKPFDPQTIERLYLYPEKPFPFPWTADVFFDTMPECVLEEGIELAPFGFDAPRYDLIVLAYQPWFLSPSLPVTSLLQNPLFQRMLKDTPVVTLIGGRNMWLNAQESVKLYIRKAEGKLVGNIPFMDRTSNLISAVTILHWMLTGRKDRKWNIFPLPGVSDEDIKSGARFGNLVKEALEVKGFDNLQASIMATGLIEIPTDILFIEQRAKKLFRIWANLIKKKGNTPGKRKTFVTLFKYYLLVALFMVAPLLLLAYNLLVAPFTGGTIKKKKEYFYGLETK